VAAVARGIGHEFGNLLQQIIGSADLGVTGAPEDMKKALETVLKAGERAAGILQRFKDLAKPSEQTQAKKSFYLTEPIQESLTLLNHELKKRRIRVLVSGPQNPEEARIIGVHSALVQVFMNLLINALSVIQDGSEITIKLNTTDGNIEAHVHDRGPGIPDEILGRIFETFFTTKGDLGTGLGLAICKEIVEILHGGELTAGNHPQGGAEFVVSLPREGSS
jgi:signal transduction histidine kinase